MRRLLLLMGWWLWACGGQTALHAGSDVSQDAGNAPQTSSTDSSGSAEGSSSSTTAIRASSTTSANDIPVQEILEQVSQASQSCYRVRFDPVVLHNDARVLQDDWETHLQLEASAFGDDVRFERVSRDVLLARDGSDQQMLIQLQPEGFYAVCPLDALAERGLQARDVSFHSLLACDTETCLVTHIREAQREWPELELVGQRAKVVIPHDLDSARQLPAGDFRSITGDVWPCVLSAEQRLCLHYETETWQDTELSEGLPPELFSLCPEANLQPSLPLDLFYPTYSMTEPGPALFGISSEGIPFGLYSNTVLASDDPEMMARASCAPLPEKFAGLTDGGFDGWFVNAHVGYNRVLLLTPQQMFGDWESFVTR